MSLLDKKPESNSPELEVITGGQAAGYRRAAAYNEDAEIDLVDLMFQLLDKLHYLIFFFLLGALVFNAYAYFRIAPTYQSTAKMYIVSASDDSVVDLTDLNIGTSLTADYEELMLSYPVLDQVIEKMGLDMSFEQLAKMITINNPADTRILSVTATSTDPELARDIANTMVEVSVTYLPRTMGTEEPNIAQEARTAIRKSGPSYTKYTLMGGILGTLACCAYFIIRYLMDDTLRNAEDVEKYFGVVPLTTIPDMSHSKGNKGGRKK